MKGIGNAASAGITVGTFVGRSAYSLLSKGGKQSNKSKIFRWECRYRVMERLNEKGIHSLDDLMNKDKLNSLKDILLSKWDEAIIFDREAIDLTSIPEVNKMKLLEGLNDDYWKGNTHTIKSRKRRYKELNVKYAGRDLIRIIHEMIFDKCDMLLNNEAEIYFIEEQESNLNFTGSDHLLNFTGSDRVNQKSFTLPIHQNIATKQHSVKNTNFTVSDHLYKPSETVNLSKQELKELAFKLIGEYSSISDTSLLNEIKEQTNCSNERDIGNDMYRKGIIKKTIPFENRFHLSWSTPF